MKLTIGERIRLMSLLPQKGNFLTLTVVREAAEVLEFPAAEQQELGIKQDGDRVLWDPAKDPNKDVPLSDAATEVIVAELKALDERKELTLEDLELYKKFVNG